MDSQGEPVYEIINVSRCTTLENYTDLEKQRTNNEQRNHTIMIPSSPKKVKRRTKHKSSTPASVRVAMMVGCLALIGVFLEAGALVYIILGNIRDQKGSEMDSLDSNGNISVQNMSLTELQKTIVELFVANSSYFQSLIGVTDTVRLDNLQTFVSTLNATTTDQLNDLRSSVNMLQTTSRDQLSYLWSSVNTLATEHNLTTTQVESLLTNTQPYRNCIEETSSCTNSQSRSGTWSFCRTPRLPIDKAGYYTIGMRCLYNPPPEKWDTSTLRQRGSEVECLCVAISGTSPQGAHVTDTFSLFTCTLTVTRCPLS